MKVRNLFLIALCVALLALSGCGMGESSASVPRPFIAMPGAELDLEISLPEAEFDSAPTAGYVYELSFDVSAVLAKVESCFGVDLSKAEVSVNANGQKHYTTDEYAVMIDEPTGYWRYMAMNSGEKTLAGQADAEVISDQAAEAIAEKFIADNGLWKGEIYNTVVTYVTGGGWTSEEYIKEINVHVYPSVDGKAVLGVFRIMVALDLEGNITAVYKLANEVEKRIDVGLKDYAAIQNAISAKEYSASASKELTDIQITDSRFEYYADAVAVDGKTYLYPVYVINAAGKTADGKNETFDVIIDGIRAPE